MGHDLNFTQLHFRSRGVLGDNLGLFYKYLLLNQEEMTRPKAGGVFVIRPMFLLLCRNTLARDSGPALSFFF